MRACYKIAAALCLLLCACGASADDPAPSIGEVDASQSAELPETLPPDEEEPAPPEAPDEEDALPPLSSLPDDTFVLVRDYIPSVSVDLKYATEDNFTGEIIYDFTDAYLRSGTVKKLQAAAEQLAQDGYALKIWDAFRPPAAQFRLWEICPDPTYVSNPNNGFSSHSRGNTLDITLVDAQGNEVEMPTGFDDFSPLADRDYSDVNSTAAANAQYLESIMLDCGFHAYRGEWWHFSDSTSYDVEQDFLSDQIHTDGASPS